MESTAREIAEFVARACELASVFFIAQGALEAVGRMAWNWRAWGDLRLKKAVWLRFAASILLALEFALGADIARTSIAPSWDDIGQLAAIAAIRTVLNLFLERDLENAQRQAAATGEAAG